MERAQLIPLRVTGNRRAWTYQERLLSRRAIFFTADQAFFVCSCAIWSESTIAEPEPHSLKGWFIPKPLKAVHEPPQRQYTLGTSARGQSLNQLEGSASSFDGYQKLITEFSGRQLSWPSDGVNAVLGILKLLGRADSERMQVMYHGLPATFFDVALLWHPRCESKRPTDWKGQPPLPSWSWGGWDRNFGRGVFWDQSTLDAKGLALVLPVVTWYVIYGQGSRFSIPFQASEGLEDRELQSKGPPGFTWQDRVYSVPPDLPESIVSPRPYYYLYCQTTAVTFHLGDRLSWATLTLHKANITSPYALIDDDGTFVGTIILSPSQAEEVQGRKLMKFIFLSYATRFDPRISLATTQGGSAVNHSYAGMLKRSKWRLVNCMWIRRAGKAVERRQIAKIKIDAWRAADPKAEWFVLG